MQTQDVIRSQYSAALAMLKQAIERCPDSLWDARDDRNRFWHVAYHVLFHTHLYLQPTEADFRPWPGHRPGLNRLDDPPSAEPGASSRPEPLIRSELLDYLVTVEHEVEARTAALVLDAPSGFFWLPFNKLELQFYNIRHIQQHTGELMERLGARSGVDIDWVGQADPGKSTTESRTR